MCFITRDKFSIGIGTEAYLVQSGKVPALEEPEQFRYQELERFWYQEPERFRYPGVYNSESALVFGV